MKKNWTLALAGTLMVASAQGWAADLPKYSCKLVYDMVAPPASGGKQAESESQVITDECTIFKIEGFSTGCISLEKGADGAYAILGQIKNPSGVLSLFSSTADQHFSLSLTGSNPMEFGTLECKAGN